MSICHNKGTSDLLDLRAMYFAINGRYKVYENGSIYYYLMLN
jgi:hypothetical protein